MKAGSLNNATCLAEFSHIGRYLANHSSRPIATRIFHSYHSDLEHFVLTFLLILLPSPIDLGRICCSIIVSHSFGQQGRAEHEEEWYSKVKFDFVGHLRPCNGNNLILHRSLDFIHFSLCYMLHLSESVKSIIVKFPLVSLSILCLRQLSLPFLRHFCLEGEAQIFRKLATYNQQSAGKLVIHDTKSSAITLDTDS